MTAYDKICEKLRQSPRTWLVTGVAGFIGSALLETLLKFEQKVVGLDNFSTGHRRNLDDVRKMVSSSQWGAFAFIEGDINDPKACARACTGVDYVLHQAALGSVPRSIEEPLVANHNNVTGFLTMLIAARDAEVTRFVYASSSAVYGDSSALPTKESDLGNCLSPYAVSKRVDELYAEVFGRCYGMQTVGLRYFNVFGPRQDPNGAYAAVIPLWIKAMIKNKPVQIFGDGETTRDFSYVANIAQANILAATVDNADAVNRSYNVANGGRTTLNELFQTIRSGLLPFHAHLEGFNPSMSEFRAGDIRYSQADISDARRLLGYEPTHSLEQGMIETLASYIRKV